MTRRAAWCPLGTVASVRIVSRKRKQRKVARKHVPEAESVTVHLGGPPGDDEMLAAERASSVDRRWFERHPGADAYARVAVPHEADRFMGLQGWQVPPGHHLVVVAEQVEPGRRLRHPMNVYRGDGPNGTMLQEHLDWILWHWRTEIRGKERFLSALRSKTQ